MMMWKTVVSAAMTVAAALGVLLLPGAARAEVRDFELFSVDVPAGWTAEQQGVTVVMKAAGSDVSVSMAVAPMGEAKLEEIAKKLYEQLGGVDFEEDDEGDFIFSYRDTAGVDSLVYVIGGDDGNYLVIAWSGHDKPGAELIEDIINSVKFHVPDPSGEDGGGSGDASDEDDEEEYDDDE